ncbi:hypothetical protein KSF78_0009609, partial [Schistosoma japonicum]
ISPSTLYGEEGGARLSYQFFNSQLITANQLTPTASRHQLYMGKKVVHDIPTNFLIHNSSPPINLHPQHLAINFIWGRSISPSTLYGEEGGARHSYQFFNSQLITANQLTPTASRHQLYMGKKVVHDIPTNFLIHNSSPPINLHPQHLAINFIWGRSISPSTLYGEEGGARHSYQFFNSQLITANQLTPTASRHQLYMGKKVVHDIPTNFLIHNSSPPINLHPQHLAINFIWGRSISPSTLYGEEGGARHSYQFFNSQLITANQLTPTASRHQLYMGKNISPSTLYGEEGGARHSYQFFNSQLITANQLTPTASRHQLYMGKKVVHDIPTNFLIHNSSPPINLHPQHLAINFIWGRSISPSTLYGEEGGARHSYQFFNSQLITANQLTPTASRHQLYMGKKVVHDIPTNFLIHNSSPPINLHPSISPSTLYGEEGGARHSYQFFNSQLITANQLTPTASRHQLYMGKKVVHDIPTNFLIHNSSPPINLHPQHLAINFIWGRSISPSTLYGEEGGARHSYQFFNSQLITANQLTPTASRHQLYMGKKVVHDIPTNFLIHNSSPPINLHPQHLAINFIWGEEGGARHSYQFFNSQLITANQLTPTASRHQLYMGGRSISPSTLYGEEGGARHSYQFFNSQLITANQLTPTASRHQLYMGKKVVHDIPTNFFLIHNSSPPINLHPQHLAINFIWGRRWCTTFLPFFFNSQLITANQLTPTASRHQLYMGKKVVHDIPTNFLIHNSSPPINLHPQHLAINFIWGRSISPSTLYGEEGGARHSYQFFNSQLITANQLTPTASRHQLYMGKKMVHDIPTNFLIHNSSPPINLHPQHLAINFIWGRSISPSTLYGEEGGARHSYHFFLIHNSSPPINLHPQHLAINFMGEEGGARHSYQFFNSQLITANQLTPTASRHQLYMGKKVVHDIPTNFLIHNSSPPINLHPQHLAINFIWGRSISPSTLYGEEGGARHSYQFFNSQLITANQLTPTASRHQLYMGKKVVHDIPTNFLIHNSSPPINLHPQHLAINFIWGRSISPSTLYGEEGGARHSYQFFNSQLITANQLTPTASRHQLYMGKKVVHDIPTNFLIHNSSPPINFTPTASRHQLYMGKKVVHDIPTNFLIHNSSPPINLHPQHLAINFIWGRSISPSTLYGEEGGARHSYQFFNSQLITANQLTPTASRHQLYMGKKVVHDIPTNFFFNSQLITANQLTPTASRHQLYMGKKVVHDIPTNFLIHNSSPPSSTYTHSISPSTLYGEEGGARHSYQFFNSQLITANQLTPTASRHQLYMGKKVVHDIPTNFLIHNSSPPINLHPQHLAINFIWGRSISPSTLYGEEGGARHSYQFFNSQLITANQLTPTASRHQLYMGKKVVHDIPTNFLIHNSSPPINLHPQHLAINFIWGRRWCTTFLQFFFNSQLITANQLTPTASRHQLYMGKKVVHDIPTNFLIHNSSPPINLHPQHLAINFMGGRSISPSTLYGEEDGARHSYQFFNSHSHHRQSTYTHSISPSTLYGEEGGARHSYQFFNSQLITANQLTPTASRHQLYMGKKVVHDIPTNFLIHNSSPPINLHPQHLAINFIWGRSISPSTLYGEEGGARHSYQFFNSQLITANQLTPTASRHQLYMGKKVVHDIPTNFLIHNSSPPINLHPQHLAINFIWGRRWCTTFLPFFFLIHNSSPPINLHPQHLAINFIWGRSISPSTLYGEEGGARHSYQFFNSQLITANQLTPTASRHQLYMGKKVVHDIPTNFLIHNSSPPINLHPQHLAINFIWGRSISPSTLYGEEGGARHSYQFFNSQLITANQLTPTASRHQLYMGKKVVHDIPTNFLIHNSSPPINLHPQHLAINFIWGRSISPSTLYGEEGGARHSYQFFNSQLITANQLTPTASRHQLYMGKKVVHDIPTNFLIHNSSPPINLHPQHLAINFIWGRSISPSTLYGEEGGARHSYQFFNSQLITANQLTPTASRHQLYMGKKVVHDIPTNFLIHNSSPPINLHPQHLAINFIWGRSISPSTLYGEEGGARHSYQFFNSQLITANQLTPTASRHQLYMGKKVVHDIPTNFLIHNSSPPINLHPQHLAINFIWGRSISPSTLYGEEGGARHSYQFFNSQLITANQLTPTASRHQLYMGKKVVHDIPTNFLIHNSSPPINLHPQHLAINFIWGRSISPSTLYGEEGGARHSYQFFNSQLITANQLTPTASRHQLYMGKKVVHDIPTNFLIHNSSPPINLHPQHLAINFIWGRSISPSTLYGEEGGARHSYQFFNSQLITANQLTPTASRHQLYMGKKVVHDIPTNFLIHNSSPPINLHPQHLAINFIWGRSISPSTLYGEEGGARHSYQFFNSQLITANQLTPTASRHQLYMGKKVVHDIPTNFLIHNSSPPINLHPQHLAINFIWGRSISPSTLYGEEGGARHSYQFFNSQLITANQLTPTASRHQLYMGKKVVHDIPTNFLIHNSSPPINLHPQHLAINFIWGRSISPSTLYGEEGGARHSYQFFNSQLITANQLTPTASRHQLYMGKKVVHDIPTNFLIHNSSPPINLHPQHLAINFIWGRSISPSTLYGEEGGARHSYQFFNSQLITANQLTPTASRHQLYMGKKVVHDIPTNFLIHNSSPPINLHPQHLAINFIWGRSISPSTLYGEEGGARHSYQFFNSQLITANQLTPTASRHQLYMGKKVVHDIPTNFLIHNSSPPINLHPQHLAINFIWGRSISPSTLYGEEGGARHSYQFFNSQLITANQLTPTASRHQLYMGKKVVHDIPTNFLIHNSSPPINLHPQHLAINFIWGRRWCTTFLPIF